MLMIELVECLCFATVQAMLPGTGIHDARWIFVFNLGKADGALAV